MRIPLRGMVGLGCALAVAASASGQAKGGVTVQAGSGEATLTIGGLVQGQFEDGDRGDSRFPATGADRFLLRRARLNATGAFAKDFDFRLELDLAGSLSTASGLRAQLTDGYVTWTRYSFANLRAGQFKTPFGFEQLYPDPRLITAERSLVNDRLTLSRQLGAQLSGAFLDKRLTYAVGTFNGNGVNNSNNDNNKFLWAGRVTATPWKANAGSWSVGANGFTSEDTGLALADLNLDSTPATPDKDGIFTGKRHGFGADSQIEAGPFSLWVEYLRVRFEPTSARPAARFDSGGGYAQAAWFLVPDRFQAVLKYETFDPRRGFAGDDVSTWTAGLNYYLRGHDLKLLLDYLRTDLGDLGGRANLSKQNKLLFRFQALF